VDLWVFGIRTAINPMYMNAKVTIRIYKWIFE
jgi:hypothetical protein